MGAVTIFSGRDHSEIKNFTISTNFSRKLFALLDG